MMVTGGNITGIVDQLVKEGLVERVDEPSDRRAWRVRLTRAGDKAFAEMARAHEEWVVELLGGFSRRDSDSPDAAPRAPQASPPWRNPDGSLRAPAVAVLRSAALRP